MRGWELEGRIGIVTGGGSGIGAAIVAALADVGAKVISFDPVPAAQSPADLALTVDVTDKAAVEAAFAEVLDRYGRIDFLVNNAGVDREVEPSSIWREDTLDRTIDVNLKGVYHCMRFAINAMIEQNGGAIVNVGSAASCIGVPTRPAYTASKHGVLGLTRTAAREFGRKGIRTNIVCPGATRTPLFERVMAISVGFEEADVAASVPLGRLGDPSEIADAVLWLVSARASYVNGAVIAVDGGQTAG